MNAGNYETGSPEETKGLGRDLAASIKPGDVITLDGDLGAGKTVFVKGFAEGLGVPDPRQVTSPTYTILQVHEGGRLPLYHFDAYRLSDASEAVETGMEELLYGAGVCLIEWAKRVEELMPENRIAVTIDRLPEKGDDCRRIRIEDYRDTDA